MIIELKHEILATGKNANSVIYKKSSICNNCQILLSYHILYRLLYRLYRLL